MTRTQVYRCAALEKHVRQRGTFLWLDTDGRLWIFDPSKLGPSTLNKITENYDDLIEFIAARAGPAVSWR